MINKSSITVLKASLITADLIDKNKTDKTEIGILTVLAILIGILQLLLRWDWTAKNIIDAKQLNWFRRWQMRRMIKNKTKIDANIIIGSSMKILYQSTIADINTMFYEVQNEL